jgi:DNA polymerase III epsilon subunit-like protein
VLPIAVDAETTGLGQSRGRDDAIIEIAFAHRDPATGAVRTWSRLCNPGEKYLTDGYADEALEINGIGLEEVRSAAPAQSVAAELRRELRALARRAEIRLLAFNADFDRPFLAAPPWHILGPWGECVMREAHAALAPYGKRPRLVDACKALQVTFPGSAHRAAHDAHAALLVHEALQARHVAPPPLG